MTNTSTTQAHTNKVCLASLYFNIFVLISRSPRSDQYARQPPLIQLPMEKSADSQWPEQTTTLTSWSIIVIAIIIITSIDQKQWWTPAGHGRAGVGRGEIEWRELAKTRWHFCNTFKFDFHLTVSRLSPHCVSTLTSLCLTFSTLSPHFHFTSIPETPLTHLPNG